MDFLDNLENSLKNLESREERDGADQQRQADYRARALAAGPWAEKLKNGDWTKKLFDEAAIAGHRIRAKVYMAWLEQTLRLEVKGRTLVLEPTPDGIVGVQTEPDGSTKRAPVDLDSEPAELLSEWLG